jgi:hypothetical protein
LQFGMHASAWWYWARTSGIMVFVGRAGWCAAQRVLVGWWDAEGGVYDINGVAEECFVARTVKNG